jgi:hypothetical protein
LSALKFGKNGLVRGSSQNLAALAAKTSVDESTSESIPGEVGADDYCTFESASDLLIYVVPTDDKLLQSAIFSKASRASLKAQKKREFLRGLSKKVLRDHVPIVGADSNLDAKRSATMRRAIDYDIEAGASHSSPRSPNRRLSLQISRQPTVLVGTDDLVGEDPRTQLTSDSMISLGTDDETAQVTHRSDDLTPLQYGGRSGVWNDSPIPASRTLPSRNYEDPSTQHTIS